MPKKKKTTKRRPVRRTPVTTRAAAAGPTQVRHTLPEKVAALPNFECPYDTGSFGVYGYPGETTIALVFADGKEGTRVTFPKRCGGALCNAIMNACGIASIRQKRDGVTSFLPERPHVARSRDPWRSPLRIGAAKCP